MIRALTSSMLFASLVVQSGCGPGVTDAGERGVASSGEEVARELVVESPQTPESAEGEQASAEQATAEPTTEDAPATPDVRLIPQWTHRGYTSLAFTSSGDLLVTDEIGHFSWVDGETGLVRFSTRIVAGEVHAGLLASGALVSGSEGTLTVRSLDGDHKVERDVGFFIGNLVVDPTGTRFALQGGDDELHVFGADEGAIQRINTTTADGALNWATPRRMLVQTRRELVVLRAGSLERAWETVGERHVVSRDGRTVYVQKGLLLQAFSMREGSKRWEREVDFAANRLGLSDDGTQVFLASDERSRIFPASGEGEVTELAASLVSLQGDTGVGMKEGDAGVYHLRRGTRRSLIARGVSRGIAGPNGRVVFTTEEPDFVYWNGSDATRYAPATEHSTWFSEVDANGSGAVFGGRFGMVAVDKNGMRELECRGDRFYGVSWERKEVYAGRYRCHLETGLRRSPFARGGLRWASPDGRYLLSSRGVLWDQESDTRRSVRFDPNSESESESFLYCDPEMCSAVITLVGNQLIAAYRGRLASIDVETGDVTEYPRATISPGQAPLFAVFDEREVRVLQDLTASPLTTIDVVAEGAFFLGGRLDVEVRGGWRSFNAYTGEEVTRETTIPRRVAEPSRDGWRVSHRDGVVVTNPAGERLILRSLRTRPVFNFAASPEGRWWSNALYPRDRVIAERRIARRDASGVMSVVAADGYDEELLAGFFQ